MTFKPDALPGTLLGQGVVPKPPQPPAGQGASRVGLSPGLQPQGASGPGPALSVTASVVQWSDGALTHALQHADPSETPLAGRLAWPHEGLGSQVQGQANQLLQALPWTASVSAGSVRWQSAQLWSPAFLAQWLAHRAAGGAAPMQTWGGRHVQIQVPAGQYSLFMRLLSPNGQFPGASASAGPLAPIGTAAVPVLRWPQTPLLGAGALAWVLGCEEQDTRSVLLVLDWGPRREAVVYGREWVQPQHDPWLMQAQLWASGVRERPHAAPETDGPCDKPDCPYKGVVACPQPFCPATGAVSALAAL